MGAQPSGGIPSPGPRVKRLGYWPQGQSLRGPPKTSVRINTSVEINIFIHHFKNINNTKKIHNQPDIDIARKDRTWPYTCPTISPRAIPSPVVGSLC